VRERQRDYELVFIVSPLAANEEHINGLVERMRQNIESNGGQVGTISQSPPWGRRKLAYPIREYVSGEASRRNFSEGFYMLMTFKLDASKVIELERTIKLTDTILRHLITVAETRATSGRTESAAEKSEA
jgi:small subunit ribosomal protein S6